MVDEICDDFHWKIHIDSEPLSFKMIILLLCLIQVLPKIVQQGYWKLKVQILVCILVQRAKMYIF